ncbi:MAG: hypothetical protein KDK55_06395 [Chlamydiia bacterium]|nr:hypothetical protein [Chlamydiia bacterium]
MNTYRHLYSELPNGGGEGMALLERDDRDFDQFQEGSRITISSLKPCSFEEIVIIEGKLSVSF